MYIKLARKLPEIFRGKVIQVYLYKCLSLMKIAPWNSFHGCAAMYSLKHLYASCFVKVLRASIPVKLLKIPAFSAQKGTVLLSVPGALLSNRRVVEGKECSSRGRGNRVLCVQVALCPSPSSWHYSPLLFFLLARLMSFSVFFPAFSCECMYECILKQKWDHPCFRLFPKKGT